MEILTAKQSAAADKETIAKIMPEIELVENAGFAAACQILKRYGKAPVVVLCGSGNNGADGFVTARILKRRGWPVEIAFSGDLERMKPASKTAMRRFGGDISSPSAERLIRLEKQGGLFVDALFGTGLSRPIDGFTKEYFSLLNTLDIPCVAIDLPSGIESDTGRVAGTAPVCDLTVTFCRPKPAHYLYPAKEYCGETVVCPIGITDQAVENTNPYLYELTEDLFSVPVRTAADHKYSAGSVLIVAGKMTGAAKLAAAAARYAGAGFVQTACEETAKIILSDAAGLIVNTTDATEQIKDPKLKTVVIGMGMSSDDSARELFAAVCDSGKSFVADAGVLPFAATRKFDLSKGVLTPHSGEFSRMFPDLTEQDKVTQALTAAQRLGAVLILKGADTVVAAPNGIAAIATTTDFRLSAAGTGDVLSGVTGAMLSKGLPPFEAACAAVFKHTQAALSTQGTLIAEDFLKNLV